MFTSGFLFIAALYLRLFASVSVSGVPLARRNTSSQDHPPASAHCLAHISAEDRQEIERGLLGVRNFDLADREVGSENASYAFNVSFNAVYVNETRTGGWIPDGDVAAQIRTLNADYNSTGISFVLVKTTRIKNEDWFANAYPGSEQEQAMKMQHNIGDAATLNIYTLTFNASTTSLGTSAIPSAYYRSPKSDGVMVRHSTVTNGFREHYNMGRTLTHEVGHWLGLFHTFEGSCDDGVGDNIADTPPQASASDGCPVGRDSCPGDGPDLINNFMDYSYDACMTSFTKGQGARMREAAKAFRQPGGKTAPPESAKAKTK